MTHPSQAVDRLLPITERERHTLLDVLRGFALFGVLLANLGVVITAAAAPSELQALHPQAFQKAAGAVLRVLVAGKFVFIFSLLFGLGLAVQMERAAARGRTLSVLYLRRLGILLLIGLAHAVVLWWGDILAVYAVLGLVLFRFRFLEDRTLLGLSAFLLYVPPTLVAARRGLMALLGGESSPGTDFSVLHGLEAAGYLEVAAAQREMYLAFYTSPFALSNGSYALGAFLVGYVVGRRRLLQEAEKYLDHYRLIFRWCLPFGIFCSSFGALSIYFPMPATSPWAMVRLLPINIGSVTLSAAYISAVVLCFQHPAGQRWLNPLASVGRTALSNYLMQSVLYLLLVTGVGLSLGGRLGPLAAFPIAAAFFLLQIVWSHVWLKFFRFGPAEWLWRSLAYGQRQPLRSAGGTTQSSEKISSEE